MTRTLLSVSLAALAITAHAGSAFAQTQGNDAASGVTRSAGDLTCTDLISMDDESVSNLLYFVAGYAARASGDIQADAGLPGAADDDEGAAEPAHALGPTGSDNTARAAATAGPASEVAAATPADAGMNAMLASVGGFDIDVEQALANCEAAPEAKLIDILDQQHMSNN